MTASPGNPERRMASIASGVSASTAASSQRELFNSSRSGGEDVLDKRIELRIVGVFMPQEPAPERGVFASQQAFERGPFGWFRIPPAALKIPQKQLVQLAHAAPRAPAQPGIIAVLHDRHSTQTIIQIHSVYRLNAEMKSTLHSGAIRLSLL